MIVPNAWTHGSLLRARLMVALAGLLAATPAKVAAQSSSDSARAADLASVLRRSVPENPSVKAAQRRVVAAESRVRPAGAWSDPTLMLGILNLPITAMKSAPGEPPGDDMTMKMIGVEQMIPYPGKLSRLRRVAELEVDAARATLDITKVDITYAITNAWVELAYLDEALAIISRNQASLSGIIRTTEAQYGSGLGRQEDVFKARVEAARLGESAGQLYEERRKTLAELNALLNRPAAEALDRPTISERLRHAGIASDPARITFVAETLGARAAGSPLPSIPELQDLALGHSPVLKEKQAMLSAQEARVSVAARAWRSDIGVSLQYGQRVQRPDMISAVASISLPIQKRARQDRETAGASAELSALGAELDGVRNEVFAAIARAVSDIEQSRTQIALYRKAILPQGEAASLASAASYASGKGGLLDVLNNQNTYFTYQTLSARALANFAKAVADLERIVGVEVVR